MHLVVYFCGTGDPGNSFPNHYDYVNKEKVKTVFVKGCQDPNVCNSGLFPDLKAFSERFTKQLFDQNQQIATTNPDVLASIGINLDRTTLSESDKGEEIESITLCGYSRGAVTCFEVARQLNQLCPNIPVDIIADQPVPGNCYQGPGTNAASVADCSDLQNLNNVSVILGAYTGESVTVDLYVKLNMPTELEQYKTSYILVKDELYYVNSKGQGKLVEFNPNFNREDILLKFYKIDPTVEGKHSLSRPHYLTPHSDSEAFRKSTDRIHRGFFSQIVPKLPQTAQRDLIVIPRESHHTKRVNGPQGDEHMHMKVAQYLNKRGVVDDEDVARKKDMAQQTYSQSEHMPANPFPELSNLQSFFGLEKEEAYKYLDKLHPTRDLRDGMVLAKDESLGDWWKKKDTSYFSTQLTKDLVSTIENTSIDNKEQLKELFQQADAWLMIKENSSTSRYDQVECLRNNIYHLLIKNHKVDTKEIAEMNRLTLQDTGYFLKHWEEGSMAASWFKTDETRLLDKAFEQHANANPSKDNDQMLLTAMDSWLTAKKDSQSSRYDLVIEMREHLSEVIKNSSYNVTQQYKDIIQTNREPDLHSEEINKFKI